MKFDFYVKTYQIQKVEVEADDYLAAKDGLINQLKSQNAKFELLEVEDLECTEIDYVLENIPVCGAPLNADV
jgi:hypothetical protein